MSLTGAAGIDLIGGTIAAFGALLVYDVFFVTFDQEVWSLTAPMYLILNYFQVSLVWFSRWSSVKVLYILNRYLPFVDTFLSLHLLTGTNTDQECLFGFKAVTWLIVVGIIIAEIILMFRTYALWGRRPIILGILVSLGLAVYIPAIVIAQLEVETFAYAAVPTGGCAKTKDTSPIIFVAFLLLIINETTIVVLTLIQARLLHRESQSTLVLLMYKDGLFYYIYLLSFSLVNLLIAVAAPPEFANWLTTPQRVMHSLLCTRVLLHIRGHSLNPDVQIATTQASLSFASVDLEARAAEQGRSELSLGSGPGSESGSGKHTLLSFQSSIQTNSEPTSSRWRGDEKEYRSEPEPQAETIELQSLSHSPRVKFKDSYEEGEF
ncbi:hypothetical protein DFH11DRAFT_1602889 [Phellopilus nigrolimitatus]|nr:hypothetical protein DFH11DRAFT_1602889 [Phellopilus nigrolimitatus]